MITLLGFQAFETNSSLNRKHGLLGCQHLHLLSHGGNTYLPLLILSLTVGSPEFCARGALRMPDANGV